MSERHAWLAVAAVGLWSTNAYAAEIALAHLGVAWLLLVQYGSAALVLGLVTRASGLRRRWGEPARSGPAGPHTPPGAGTGGPNSAATRPGTVALGVVGLTGTVLLQYAAFALAPIVAANVLAYAWPLIAAFWLAATRRDRGTTIAAVLAVVGFLGVLLIFAGPGPQSAAPATAAETTWGYAAALGSAICMAAYTLWSGRASVGVENLLLPATVVGVVSAGVLVVVTHGVAPTSLGVGVATFIGVGPMAAGYGLWTRAMRGDGAARLAPLGYATPMLSTGLLLATGAPASVTMLVGIAVVLVSSVGVLVVGRRRRPASDAPTGAGTMSSHRRRGIPRANRSPG